jgi:hypothetical protein
MLCLEADNGRDSESHGQGQMECQALLEAHARLATQLGARRITDTNSGHHVQVEQPQLVVAPFARS